MKPVGFHPAAREEVKAAADYYAQVSLDTGRQFYDEIDRLVSDIGNTPLLWRLFDPPARRHFTMRFPYAIIYLDQPARIWIIAVMHFKQRPGYWKERLAD